MNKVAAVTMVHKSHAFFAKWVRYYGDQLGIENLFVVLHGECQINRSIALGANIIVLPRVMSVDFDIDRWKFLSRYSASLLQYYGGVICGDCDELVLMDRRSRRSLSEYILASNAEVVAPVGGHLIPTPEQMATSAAVNWASPVTDQFSRFMPDSRYSKPCIVKSEQEFLSGGHGIARGGFELDHALLLVHLKYLEADRYTKAAEQLKAELRTAISESPGEHEKFSSTWRMGSQLEMRILNDMVSRPDSNRAEPFRFTANLIKLAGVRHADHSCEFRPLRSRAQPFHVPDWFRGLA